MTTAVGVLGWDSAGADHDKGLEDDDKFRDARERRSKGLEKFILALSDQQLVTGLAVLTAGYISPCSTSIYHFNIIAALGWFSSTTHLSTLVVLQFYFIEHPRLRNWRVVAMLLIFGLLAIAQAVTVNSTLDNSLPIRCLYTPGSFSTGTILNGLLIISFLGATYSNRIIRLYSLDPEWSLQAWFVNGVVWALKKNPRLSNLTEIAIVCSKLPQVEQDKIYRKLKERQQYVGRELVKIVIRSSKQTKAEQGALWRSFNERRRDTRYYNLLESKKSDGYSGNPIKMRRLFIMIREVNYSFPGNLLTIHFGVVLGITQVIGGRQNEPSAGIVGSQNDLNFGQLVPLLLMLLPLFAAGEAYFGNTGNL